MNAIFITLYRDPSYPARGRQRGMKWSPSDSGFGGYLEDWGRRDAEEYLLEKMEGKFLGSRNPRTFP